LGVIFFKKKKKKNTKTLQNSLAKAPKMQRELKYILTEEQESPFRQKEHTRK